MELLSVTNAAARLGVPRRTLMHWLKNGRVQGQRVGPVWAIPASEVERLAGQPRPKPGRKRGTPMPRRFQGTCRECGQTFTAARPAMYCSPRCGARARARTARHLRPQPNRQ